MLGCWDGFVVLCRMSSCYCEGLSFPVSFSGLVGERDILLVVGEEGMMIGRWIDDCGFSRWW